MKNTPWIVLLSSFAAFDIEASIMEEVVVTATRTEKVILQNPYSVSLVTKEQIEISPADQIAEYISDLPGIYVSDAGQAGFKRIRIRGEEARRMAFLIDGQEFMDHREVGVPLLVDPSSIERIEVVRGPSSVLYGPKAMGGVINIITDSDVTDPLSTTLSAVFDSATQGTQYSAGLSGVSGNYQWKLSAMDNQQEERDTPAGEMENTSYESDGVSFSLKRLTEKSRLTFGYEDFNSRSDIYVEPEVRFSFPFVDFRLDSPQRDREKLRLAFEQETSGIVERFQINAYTQKSDRQFNSYPSIQIAPFLPRFDTSILTTSELVSDAVNGQINWNIHQDHALITGIQLLEDTVDQDRLREVRANGVLTSSATNFDEAHNRTTAIYIQDDWRINDYWSLLAGLRYYKVDGKLDVSDRFIDKPDFDDDHAVTSLSFVYSPVDNMSYRLTFSQGYIYPSLLNLAMGAYAGSRYVNPDPELKPETSDTFEFGLRYSSNSWTIDSTLFHSRADDYIDHVFCQAVDNCLTAADKIYKNTGQSSTHGIELSATYSTDHFDIYNNLTWLRRKKEYEGINSYKSGLPRLSGRLGVTYTPNNPNYPFSVDLYSRYESNADEIQQSGGGTVVQKHEQWLTVNAELNFRIGENYIINASLMNLTDRKYSGATENLYAPKRHFLVKFSARL